MTRVPLSRWDRLTSISNLRDKYYYYKKLESINENLKEIQEDETVILDAIEMTAYLEETEDLGD